MYMPSTKKDSYLITCTPSISLSQVRTHGLVQVFIHSNHLCTPKVLGGQKKKRKEQNKVESSSQGKKSKKSSQNEIPSKTTSAGIYCAGKRAIQTQICRKCGEPGHNRRSCKGAPPPVSNYRRSVYFFGFCSMHL